MSKVVDLGSFREEKEELETCALWDDFHETATALYTWRDYESLAQMLLLIERLKTRIER